MMRQVIRYYDKPIKSFFNVSLLQNALKITLAILRHTTWNDSFPQFTVLT